MDLYPVGGSVDQALKRELALFSDDPGFVLNVFWVLTSYLTAWSATWCAETLGVSRATSWIVGVLFAFLPHAFSRSIEHLMLVTYLVPFVLTYSILVLSGQWTGVPRWRRRLLLAGCLLLGANYVYTAFFGCFVLMVAIVGRSLSRWSLREVAPAVGVLVLIGVVTVLNLAPTVVAWRHDEIGAYNVEGPKGAGEADVYGLKIRHLLTPIPDHPVGFLRKAAETIRNGKFPLENENVSERLGMVGSVGFLGLLVLATFRLVVPGSRVEWVGPSVLAAGSLTIALLLLTTIGGFGSLFNVFVSPAIRAYNRAAVFIAYLSLFAVGSCSETIVRRAQVGGRTRLLLICLTPLIAVGGVLDQAPLASLEAQRGPSARKFRALHRFVTRVEATVGEGAAVYQLPHASYPHSPPIASMPPHDHLAAAILSSRLRWSWPPLSGRAQLFDQGLRFLDPVALVRRLAILGFAGVWVNGAGYEDGGQAIVAALAAAAGQEPLVSRGGGYRFIPLAAVQSAVLGQLGSEAVRELRLRWTSAIDWEIPAGIPEMRTRNVVRDVTSGTVSSRGPGGALIFGPRVPLRAGRYEVRWLGHVRTAPGELHGYLDTAARGEKVIARVPIQLPDDRADRDEEVELGRVTFELDQSVFDAEFRMFVADGVELTVTRLFVREMVPEE
jgi:phosphoglycerol transferase